MRLQCTTLPFGAIDASTVYWSPFFSEEHSPYGTYHSEGWYQYEYDNVHVCHSYQGQPGFVTGIRCSGSNCDNISIQCGQAFVRYRNFFSYPVKVQNCAWSDWYSEEQGPANFGIRWITGVECSGSKCDNKRYYVCQPVNTMPILTGF